MPKQVILKLNLFFPLSFQVQRQEILARFVLLRMMNVVNLGIFKKYFLSRSLVSEKLKVLILVLISIYRVVRCKKSADLINQLAYLGAVNEPYK